jgi:hypothetical protein
MKYISGAGCSRAEVLDRLAQAMINTERAALVYGDDGTLLPEPHAPYPTVTVEPQTTLGFPTVYHITPTVGIVFYVPEPKLAPRAFARLLSARIALYGFAHLLGYRTVEATPHASIQHFGGNGSITPETAFSEKLPTKKPVSKARAQPARMFCVPDAASITDYGTVQMPYISTTAAFTWIFSPVSYILRFAGHNISSMNLCNALVSSVLYDGAGVCALDNNAVILAAADVRLLPAGVPAGLETLEEELKPRYGISLEKLQDSWLVFDRAPAEQNRYGRETVVYARSPARYPRVVAARLLHVMPAGDEPPCPPETQCLMCGLVPWGCMYVMRNARMSHYGVEMSVLRDPDDGVLICRFCFDNIDSQADTALQLQYEQYSTARTQAQALELGDKPAIAALVSMGDVVMLPGLPGAYCIGGKVIVVCRHCHPYQQYLNSGEIIERQLQVIEVPHICDITPITPAAANARTAASERIAGRLAVLTAAADARTAVAADAAVAGAADAAVAGAADAAVAGAADVAAARADVAAARADDATRAEARIAAARAEARVALYATATTARH